jgi:hypothetical protein
MRALSLLFSAAVMALALGASHVAGTADTTTRVCLIFNAKYYDIRTEPTGTTLERWSGGQMLDSNWFATLNKPEPGAMWGEGVAFAATMQTRHVWVNEELNSPASWAVVNGEDVWTFDTTINGSPTQLVFRTSACLEMTASPSTAAPPTQDPNALHRVCGTVGTTYYDMWTSPAGTVLQRFANGRWLESQGFAPLHMAAPGEMWSEGVVFAAAMQTRHAWANTEPNPTAWWTASEGEDFWTFDTTMNGEAVQHVFRTSYCILGEATPVPPTAEPTTRVCAIDEASATFFEIRTGPAGTTMDRHNYPAGTLIDSNWFAKLHMPVPLDAMWGEGVAFAAAMQTRRAWINTEPNTEAHWDFQDDQDRWSFISTANGSPVTFEFRGAICVDSWPVSAAY